VLNGWPQWATLCAHLLSSRVDIVLILGWLIPSEMVTGPTCNYSLITYCSTATTAGQKPCKHSSTLKGMMLVHPNIQQPHPPAHKAVRTLHSMLSCTSGLASDMCSPSAHQYSASVSHYVHKQASQQAMTTNEART
jgi:hypothetical protein